MIRGERGAGGRTDAPRSPAVEAPGFQAMASLKRLLKPGFLGEYLEAACRSHERPMAIAVWAEGRRRAGTGDDGAGGPRPDDRNALTLVLRAGGEVAGQVVVRAAPPPPSSGPPTEA